MWSDDRILGNWCSQRMTLASSISLFWRSKLREVVLAVPWTLSLNSSLLYFSFISLRGWVLPSPRKGQRNRWMDQFFYLNSINFTFNLMETYFLLKKYLDNLLLLTHKFSLFMYFSIVRFFTVSLVNELVPPLFFSYYLGLSSAQSFVLSSLFLDGRSRSFITAVPKVITNLNKEANNRKVANKIT